MIEAHGLVKRYGSTMAVNDLSFSIRPGLVTGFLGPNERFDDQRDDRAATGVRLICHAPHRTGPHRHSAAARRAPAETSRQPGTASPASAADAPPDGPCDDHFHSSGGTGHATARATPSLN
jgi:hypothetical protein